MFYKTDVFYNSQRIGSAEFIKQGLFYKLHCRCIIPDNGVFRLSGLCGKDEFDFGICIPFSDGFGMDALVQIKNSNIREMKLFITPSQENTSPRFLTLEAEKPFEDLELLMQTKFIRGKEGVGLQIIES